MRHRCTEIIQYVLDNGCPDEYLLPEYDSEFDSELDDSSEEAE
jgi:hypothetical protein